MLNLLFAAYTSVGPLVEVYARHGSNAALFVFSGVPADMQ